MIRVFDGEVFTCHIGKESKEELLSFAAAFEKPENCMFLMLDECDRVKGAMSVYDLVENRTPIEGVVLIEEQGKFFDTANAIFEKNHAFENQVLPLVNEQGECLVLLQYFSNKIYGEKKEGTTYDSFLDAHKWMVADTIDYSLCEQYDSYIVEKYEEYTDCIIRLLQDKYPEKPIFCLDETAKDFLLGVEYVSGVAQLEVILRKKGVVRPMYISSDFENEYGKWPGYLLGTYNSLVVMKSLFWCVKKECLGTKNPNQTILLLDYSVEGSGLVDICRFSSHYIRMARERGFIPVIDIKDQNGYFTTDSSQNVWELFFEPVSEVSVVDALESANVIRASENDMRLVDWEMNPYIYYFDSLLWEKAKKGEEIQHFVYPNKEVLNYCKENFPRTYFEGKKILGVVARGTDYRKEALNRRGSGNYVDNLDVETMISQCKIHLMLHGYEGIYLATEDEEYLEKYKEAFDEGELFYHPQKRGSIGIQQETVAQILKTEKPTEQTKQYLSVLFSLAHCDGLYASMNCGAYLAGLLGKGIYEIGDDSI